MTNTVPIAAKQGAGCWPNHEQTLLLRAALLKGEPAMRAFREWRDLVTIDVLDFGSHRLIPMLYFNLREHGVSDPWMDRFKGVYRYYWCKNNILFHKMSAVLRMFHEAGIRTMVLKGAAVVTLFYADRGLRPMQDFDVLVPGQDVRKAMSLLEANGFRPVYRNPRNRISVRHSTPYDSSDGTSFDLHWHVLCECYDWSNDGDFWEKSVALDIQGVPSSALNPTDQLLHTCWHGASWNEVPPVRWVADATVILKSSTIDWDRFIAGVTAHRQTLQIRESLAYLRSQMQASIPEPVIERLNAIPVSEREREGYRLSTTPFYAATTGDIYRRAKHEYWQITSGMSPLKKPFVYARFMQHKFNFEHVWQVPVYIPLRGMRRFLRQGLGKLHSADQQSSSTQSEAPERESSRNGH